MCYFFNNLPTFVVCFSLCVSPVRACPCAHAWQEVLAVCLLSAVLVLCSTMRHPVVCCSLCLCILLMYCCVCCCCVVCVHHCVLLLCMSVLLSVCACCVSLSVCVPRWLCACAVYVCALAASVYCVCANIRSVDRPRARPLFTVCCWCFCKIALSIDVVRFFVVLLVLQFWETACVCLCCACPRDFF